MQASQASDIRWRLGLYKNVLAHCRQGGFSLPRFLALVPDRLRLAVGESVAKIQVPVGVTGEVIQQLAAALPPAGKVEPADAAPLTGDTLRRALRLSQLDGDLDPVGMSTWLRERADTAVSLVGGTYRKALLEVGRSAGGEETAYLVHLVLVGAVRAALERSAAGSPDSAAPARAALGAAVLDLALQAVLATPGLPLEALTARLGLQVALTASPLATGAGVEALLRRPLHAYRTRPEAVALARRGLQEPLVNLDVDALVSSLATHQLRDASLRAGLARDALLELVRDALLLALLRGGPAQHPSLRLFRELAGSGQALLQALLNSRRREDLEQAVLALPNPQEAPFPVLLQWVRAAPQVVAGDVSPLGRYGDLEERAATAASGALLVLLDEKVESLRGEILSRVRWLDGVELDQSFQAGRAYRVSLDSQPLFLVPKDRQQGHLFVDVKDFTRRTADVKERAMGDFLQRFFYLPLFDLAARLRGPDPDALLVSNILGDAVAFRGDVVVLVELAVGIRGILDAAAAELDRGVSDAVGGTSSRLTEMEAELAEARGRLQTVEATLAQPTLEAGQRSRWQAELARLLQHLALLEEGREEARTRSVGKGLEAGAYLAFGAAAEHVDVSHPLLGAWSVTIAERLNEAARGTGRSALLKALRDERLARARAVSPGVQQAFRVEVGEGCSLDVARADAEDLAAAVARQDGTAMTAAVQRLAHAAWQSAQDHAVRQGAGWPRGLRRTPEFYNAGCALSDAALVAFRRARSGTLEFQEVLLPAGAVPEAFRRRWLLEQDPECFQVVRAPAEASVRHLFRRAGRAEFKGFEKEGASVVWELLPVDSEFGRDLLRLLAATRNA